MAIRRLLSALAWVQALQLGACGSLLPIDDKFRAIDDIPPFSLRLGNDTASVCNSSTPGTAGFVATEDGNDSEMFFWLFESKNDPATDPVILWMSG